MGVKSENPTFMQRRGQGWKEKERRRTSWFLPSPPFSFPFNSTIITHNRNGQTKQKIFPLVDTFSHLQGWLPSSLPPSGRLVLRVPSRRRTKEETTKLKLNNNNSFPPPSRSLLLPSKNPSTLPRALDRPLPLPLLPQGEKPPQQDCRSLLDSWFFPSFPPVQRPAMPSNLSADALRLLPCILGGQT